MTKPKRPREPALSVEKRRSLREEQAQIVKQHRLLKAEFEYRDRKRKAERGAGT